ncbi:PorP/SprF family type IX secretion system membrane protein [Parapedobacter soli]|uniref:PorP/SprF family type IX secretion system membrane protein n=1 Tax=Parapedobacter soli TaxID=416955 RepID=UPI0021C66AE5|nr:PorP/SprF family type IX secretion system membrane protein [Parapedobacter soli]
MNTRLHNRLRYCLVVLLTCISAPTVAQLRPMGATYYFNEYLLNPAMAGTQRAVKLTAGTRTQFPRFDGFPQGQAISFDYGFTEKSGVGIQYQHDRAGLISESNGAVAYAFHLPVSTNAVLGFGLAGKLVSHRLALNRVSGDLTDPEITAANDRRAAFDSDFGLALRTPRVSLQFVMANMVSQFATEVKQADYVWMVASAGYRFNHSWGTTEPKVVYRGVKAYRDLVDAGLKVDFSSTTPNRFNVFGLYHSSQHATAGFGLTHSNSFQFFVSYSWATSAINRMTTGDMEIGLALLL